MIITTIIVIIIIHRLKEEDGLAKDKITVGVTVFVMRVRIRIINMLYFVESCD